MSIDWEQSFRSWATPASDTEIGQAQYIECSIRTAISGSLALAGRNITVFTQGSYRNNTNVQADNNVDICICCNEIIVHDYTHAPHLKNMSAPGLAYTFNQYKLEIAQALEKEFGPQNITRGNKACAIRINSSNLKASVVSAVQGRLYLPSGNYLQGTYIKPNTGIGIYNWPQQNYDNGVSKSYNTNHLFKHTVRAVKGLRNKLAGEGYAFAKPIHSYLIECLIYLVPDNYFSSGSYKENIETCLSFIALASNDIKQYKSWNEINDINILFHVSQRWSVTQVHRFAVDALSYIRNN